MSRFFGPARQLGLVVRDFDGEIAHWIARGVGPFQVRRGVRFDEYIYRGTPAPSPTFDVARSFSGALNIEIITQTDAAPSPYTEFYARGGNGPQHLAYWFGTTDSFDRAREAGLAEGLTVVMEGALGFAGHRGRFVYFEGSEGEPLMVELAESLLPPFDASQAALEKAAAAFDGTDPVR